MMNQKMSTITVNMKFQKNDGTTWVVTEKDSKCKMLMIKPENGGNEERRSLSFLNKNFTEAVEVEPESIAVPVEQEIEPKAEPKKKEKKPSQKKQHPARDKFIAALDNAIAENGGYIKITYEKVGPHFIVLRQEKKGRIKFEFYTGRTDVKINMKPAVAEDLNLEYNKKEKYFLGANIHIKYDDPAIMEIVNTLLAYYTDNDTAEAEE